MSREDQYGRALKIARRAFIRVDPDTPSGRGKWVFDHTGTISNIAVRAQTAAMLAQAEETARLADEQRTANLIAVTTAQWHESQSVTDLSDQIYKRLGLR